MEQAQTGDQSTKRRKSARERAFEKVDVGLELARLEELLNQLKVDYEQFFLGVTPYQPDRLHREVKRLIRRIRKAPFKRWGSRYKLRSLEGRYNIFNDYWQRVIREKEAGVYSKDVFKANLREKNALVDKSAQTTRGQASKSMEALFNTYKQELERITGRAQAIDFNAFQQSVIARAKAFKERNGAQKLAFKVVVKDGKVTIKAKAKSAQ